MENTKIAWTDHTFNPWIGCTQISPGCANCYAKAWADRYGWDCFGEGKPRRRTKPANWLKPIQWQQRAEHCGIRERVFCASLADAFDHEVPIEWVIDLLGLIDKTPNLDWLLLTKRPSAIPQRLYEASNGSYPREWNLADHMPNVWIGTTVERQDQIDRARILAAIPATVRFLSCEPLLCQVQLDELLYGTNRLDWIIAGGESGPNARPMHEAWPMHLRDECVAAEVPFFYKQRGGSGRQSHALPLLDGKTWTEVPL